MEDDFDLCIVKNVEETCRSLFKTLPQRLPIVTVENYEETLKLAGLWAEIPNWDLPNKNQK
jgi:hypothetical protein